MKSDLRERGIDESEWMELRSNEVTAGLASNVPPRDKRGATQSHSWRTGNKPSPTYVRPAEECLEKDMYFREAETHTRTAWSRTLHFV